METKRQTLIQILTFLGITTILTVGVFIWIFNLPKNESGLYAVMMFVPGIAAIITSLLYKDKIRDYGWRFGKAKFLAYAYLLPIIVAALAYGFSWMSPLAEFYTDEVTMYQWSQMLGFELPAPALIGIISKGVIAFMIAFILVTGEEIGWSGFLTPKLLKITSIPITSVVVGLYWSVWHYPAIIGGLYNSYYTAPLWIKLIGFTLVMTSASFIRTVLISKSKSVWIGSILHASHNVILMGVFFDLTVKKGYAGYVVSETGIIAGIVYAVVAIMFWRRQVTKTIQTDLLQSLSNDST